MGSQHFSLKWNNHQKNMLTAFEHCLSTESLVDVTLACEGLTLKAHKIVLSACSPFFQSLFLENPCQHPIVIMKDVKYSNLKAVVDFMYQGEVSIAQDQLPQLLEVAEALNIKGLSQLGEMGQEGTEVATLEPKQLGYQVTAEPGLNSSSLKKRKNDDHGSSNDLNSSNNNSEKTKKAKADDLPPAELAFHSKEVDMPKCKICHQMNCVSLSTQLNCCPQFAANHSLNGKHIIASHPNDLLDQSVEDRSINDSFTSHPVSTNDGSVDVSETQDFSASVTSLYQVPVLASQENSGVCELIYPSGSSHSTIKLEYEESLEMSNKFHSSASVTDDDEEFNSNDGNKLPEFSISSRNGENEQDPTKHFPCDVCNKYFRRSGDLMRHRRTHILTCPECDKSFSQNYHLQLHMKTHVGDKCLKCHLCNETYTVERDWQNHFKAHMAEIQLNEETHLQDEKLVDEGITINRVYVCGVCHKRFNTFAELHWHQLIHTNNQKYFDCENCGRRFNRRFNLNRHKKTCMKEK